jgi:hypothetical protein
MKALAATTITVLVLSCSPAETPADAGGPMGAGNASTGGSNGGGNASAGGGSATGGGDATFGGVASGGGDATGGGVASGGGSATGGGTTAGGGTGTGAFVQGPSGCQPLTSSNAMLSNYNVDQYAWSDTACRPRTAALVRNTSPDPGGSRGGFLRQLTYETSPGMRRTVTGTGANGWNGWGYAVSHYAGGYDSSANKTGTYRAVFALAHHAQHEFKVRISPGGPVDVTMRWFFATGRSAPIYDITYDASSAGPNTVRADTRAPYGDMAFEGTAGAIGGLGWGDDHRFTTIGAGPVSPMTAWDYSARNTVPYVRMWASAVDAEMGAVQTQTFAVHVGGGDYGGPIVSDCQGRTSANQGTNCSEAGWVMPQDWAWPFQLSQYELPYTDHSHRLAWGMNYGAVGQTSVSAFGRTYSGYPIQHYAVAAVFGLHSSAATLAQVTAFEHELGAQVTGATWNESFAGWEGSATSLTINPAAGPITNPVFHVTGSRPAISRVTVNGTALAADVGYFASRGADGSVWLTLNGTISGPVTVLVQ